MPGAVAVKGLRALERDFRKMSREAGKDMRAELKQLGVPVREEAEHLAEAKDWTSPRWSKMRVGFSRGIVYVAPGARNRGGSGRPNFGHELWLVMTEALDNRRDEIVKGVADWFDKFASSFDF